MYVFRGYPSHLSVRKGLTEAKAVAQAVVPHLGHNESIEEVCRDGRWLLVARRIQSIITEQRLAIDCGKRMTASQ
jgi:hypothetical protein